MKVFCIFSCIILLSVCSADISAQTKAEPSRKNSVRAGAGINVFGTSNGDKVGPSMYLEYSREVYKYFSMDLQLRADQSIGRMSETGTYHPVSHEPKIALSLNGMVRPLAFVKWLQWLEVGAGVTCQYGSYFYGRDKLSSYRDPYNVYAVIWKYQKFYFGLDFPMRIYFIDNSRFELFAFYEFNLTMFRWAEMTWNSSNGGIMFGVKF